MNKITKQLITLLPFNQSPSATAAAEGEANAI